MSFPLAGNNRVAGALTSAFAQNRIPHAILIEGDVGTGKHTLARCIASAAVCERENRPCGECRGCHLAAVGSHPDIWFTQPEEGKKNITVAQIRAMRTEAYSKPHLADRRVFVIDRADSMNEQAQNALLKVLEEPPGAAIFVLIAESKASLLETILSRCTVFSLVPPDIQTAVAVLKENSGYAEDAVRAALQESGGNIGIAHAILEGESGADGKTQAEHFLAAFLKGEEWEMLQITQAFEKNRVGAERFLKELRVAAIQTLRNNMRYPLQAVKLARFADELPVFEQSLKTNITLNLLFSAMVCKAAECIKK